MTGAIVRKFCLCSSPLSVGHEQLATTKIYPKTLRYFPLLSTLCANERLCSEPARHEPLSLGDLRPALLGDNRKLVSTAASSATLLQTWQNIISGRSQEKYYDMTVAFTGAYAISQMLAGRLMDVIGLRWGFALACGFWGLAAMSHSLVSTVTRLFHGAHSLGLWERGNFPAAIKVHGGMVSRT